MTSVELSLALPLGVIANQLMRVESDLRFLSAKTAVPAQNGGNGNLAGQVAMRLEQINETIEAIRALVGEIERDLQPKSASSATGRRDDRDD